MGYRTQGIRLLMVIEGLKKEIQRRLLRELYMLFLDVRTGRYQR